MNWPPTYTADRKRIRYGYCIYCHVSKPADVGKYCTIRCRGLESQRRAKVRKQEQAPPIATGPLFKPGEHPVRAWFGFPDESGLKQHLAEEPHSVSAEVVDALSFRALRELHDELHRNDDKECSDE